MNPPRSESVAIAGDLIPSEAGRARWIDWLFEWRDRILSHPAFQQWAASFPLTRPIALRRSRAVFDLCAGFAYTQTLLACVRLRLFDYLAGSPRTIDEIATFARLPRDGAIRLVRAAAALRLVGRRPGGTWGTGPLGAPLIGNVAVIRMIEHNALMYEAIADPVALLRGDRSGHAELAEYYPYMSASRISGIEGSAVESYCGLMADTVLPVALEVLDAVALGGCRRLLDVGGGEGVFAHEIATRYPRTQVTVFDLPAVVERARKRLDALGNSRVSLVAGDFHRDALPRDADVATLVRILLDHDDATIRPLLKRVRESLVSGGMVVVAEPFSGVAGAKTVGDAYFGLYLAAAGRGRARTVGELGALLGEAGFRDVRVRRTKYPVYAGVVTARV